MSLSPEQLQQASQLQVSQLADAQPNQRISIQSKYLQVIYRQLAFITILVPFFGTVLAIGLLKYFPVHAVDIGLLLVLYALTTLGIEVGFHRYFSHGAFQTVTPVKVMLVILGSMAAQGGVIYWVAHHRRHHQFTDAAGDPHSPHLHGTGFLNQLRGFWHAHTGWALKGEVTNSMLFAKNLIRDPLICKLNQLHHVWVIAGLVLPAVLGGLLTWTWSGSLTGFLWGGLVRVFLGQQIIWCTNSLCHMVGSRPYGSNDRSANIGWLSIPSWGQSLHNNHHAFQNSAITGLTWWQIDPGAWVVRLLEFTGLAWNVKVPTAEMKATKKAA
jgi:stearoyl-CoA desaturase (Delta-9 desaturase)